jgi:uncharacterized coiled-coil protein SlyX
MTIDERIERLTARHEAPTQSIEMLLDRTAETWRLVEHIAASVYKLVEVTNQDARTYAHWPESRRFTTSG